MQLWDSPDCWSPAVGVLKVGHWRRATFCSSLGKEPAPRPDFPDIYGGNGGEKATPVPGPTKDRRKSKCALCGERVDLREEHYRMVTQFRAHRAAVHVECYRKLKKERPT